MSESTPPSIPPRQRPTSSTSNGRSTTSSRANPTSAWTVTPVEESAAGAPSDGPTRTVSTGRSTTSKTRVGPEPSTSSSPSGSSNGSSNGSASSSSNGSSSGSAARSSSENGSTSRVSTATRPPRSSAPTDAGTRETEAKDADAKPAAAKPAGSAAAPVADEDQPSPLAMAVDSTTSWLKKVAGATSAAITTATTRPPTEDKTMTSIPVAAPPASVAPATGSARPVAGANPAGTAARPSTGRIPTVQQGSGPRRVRLAISRLDPWSVMKLSFLLSVAVGIMIVVGVAVGWFTLNELHVFKQVDDLVTQVTGTGANSPNILQYVEFKKVISAATLIAVVDVFLLTALATIGAFLYNIVAALVGGVHVTMTDE